MKNQSYDLIGDIHGQDVKLVNLLRGLGYVPRGDSSRGEFAGWNDPEGRKVIFLGDYIDRGRKVIAVLHEVRAIHVSPQNGKNKERCLFLSELLRN